VDCGAQNKIAVGTETTSGLKKFHLTNKKVKSSGGVFVEQVLRRKYFEGFPFLFGFLAK